MKAPRSDPGEARRPPDGCRPRRRSRAAWHGIPVLLLLLVAACANRPETAPPVPPGGPTDGDVHIVERGDTLYRIAWRHGLDYKEIAAANGIGPPYLIIPGQRLALPTTGRPSETEQPKVDESREKPPRPAATESTAQAGAAVRTERVSATREPVGTVAPTRRRWPVPDKPVGGFGTKSKFVVYELGDGAAVRSATAGVVVYAGPGLGGYSHLVIVEADDRHLVAYAVNVPPAVGKGATMRPGDLVVRVGGGRDGRRFRFEVRDRGEPVDPARLIGTGPPR